MTNDSTAGAPETARGVTAGGHDGTGIDFHDGGPTDGAATETSSTNATDADATARFDRLECRVTALESELDAVRGLLGGVDAIDEAVERRASIALAKVETLEREFADGDPAVVRERLSAEPSADAAAGARDGTEPESVGEPSSAVARSSSAPTSDGPRAEPRPEEPADERRLADRLRDAFR